MNMNAVYAPDELMLFQRTVQHAMQALPAERRTSARASRIVRNVMACAATGERDPIELKFAALAGLDADTMGRAS